MSHFVTWVLIAENTHAPNIEERVGVALAPFDENTEVAEYDEPCYCVGSAAGEAAHEAAEAEYGSLNSIRHRYQFEHKAAFDRFNSLRYRELTAEGLAEYKALDKNINATWKEVLAPFEAAEKAALEARDDREKPDADCEDCKGSGVSRSTRNPKSKWDWWCVGGRWAGKIRGLVEDPTKPTRNENVAHVSKLKPLADEEIPFAIVTPDGEWHEKGHMGWFACVSDEDENWPTRAREILAKHADCLAVACDLHI